MVCASFLKNIEDFLALFTSLGLNTIYLGNPVVIVCVLALALKLLLSFLFGFFRGGSFNFYSRALPIKSDFIGFQLNHLRFKIKKRPIS